MSLPTSGSAKGSRASLYTDQNPTVTVVVCTRNRPALLRSCLESVSALNRTANEVLVVDNTPGDEETRIVAGDFGARYMIEPAPGLSYARNRGLAESTCSIVAYVDDDAIPDSNWLGLLLEPFKDPNVAAVTGRILTPHTPIDGIQEVPRFVSNRDPHWFEIATFGGLGMGSNMALRKTACEGWTAFDERLGRGAPLEIAEENYAFASLLSLGFAAVYLPDAIVRHPDAKRGSIKQEARNSFAYWLLLFSEFPARRRDLLRFLFRRMRRKRLEWPRDPQGPGDIITSGWGVQVTAALSAMLLFLRTKKRKQEPVQDRQRKVPLQEPERLSRFIPQSPLDAQPSDRLPPRGN